MLLREQLLDGEVIAVAGDVLGLVHDELVGLGAQVHELDRGLDDERAERWASGLAPGLGALVFDAGAAFGGGGAAALSQALEDAWVAVRAVAVGALIPGEAAGKVVLIGPRPDAGRCARAARAALENLARTLSIEWARYAITVTAVLPGVHTGDEQLATLIAFLASPAGNYFSGCRFELGAIRVQPD